MCFFLGEANGQPSLTWALITHLSLSLFSPDNESMGSMLLVLWQVNDTRSHKASSTLAHNEMYQKDTRLQYTQWGELSTVVSFPRDSLQGFIELSKHGLLTVSLCVRNR